jgi:glycosyltransferase involved in cell wall biosynthesis
MQAVVLLQEETMNSNAPMSVSVIVLTYKQPEVLDLIIQGLNLQTYGGDTEIIVSDDGSPEITVAENIRAVNRCKYATKYVWHPDIGYRAAMARNNGIREAKNELLIFLDGDIVPCPGLIEKHVAHHRDSKQLVAGNRIWIGELKGSKSLTELANIVPEPAAILHGEKENVLRNELLRSPHPWRACFSANLSVMKSSLVYFDERFVGWGPEDAELGYRLCVKYGFTPIYDESIRAYHLESPDAVGNVFRKGGHEAIVNYIRNAFLFCDQCPGLDPEEIFFGFPRLKLDANTNVWKVIPRSDVGEFNLKALAQTARRWLESNNLQYPR